MLPESVRQHLLDVLANAQERAAQETEAPLEDAVRPEHAAVPEDAAVPENGAVREHDVAAPEDMAAPRDAAAPEEAVPLPRRAPVANDLPSSMYVSHETLPSGLPRYRSDSEPPTEPFRRVSVPSGNDAVNGRVAEIPAQPDTSGRRDRHPVHQQGDGEDAAAAALPLPEIRRLGGGSAGPARAIGLPVRSSR